MKLRASFLLVLLAMTVSAYAGTVTLGTAGSFAVLGASTVTNTGDTVLNGNLGLYPGTSITGFPPGVVNGTIYDDDPGGVAMQAQADALTAYNVLAGLSSNGNLSGQDLGGLTLTPGVYTFNSSADLTGTLTLNAQGDPNALFVFQIGSTLTTASGPSASSVVFINGGPLANLFWQVGSSATIGTYSSFYGSILADQSITVDTGATIGCGRALALNAAVTLDTNTISTDDCAAPPSVPEPSSALLLASGLIVGAAWIILARARL
jgi:type VI secretion system secreted protein VgrG